MTDDDDPERSAARDGGGVNPPSDSGIPAGPRPRSDRNWPRSAAEAALRLLIRVMMIGLIVVLLGLDDPAGIAAALALPFYAFAALRRWRRRGYEAIVVFGDAFTLFAVLHGAPPATSPEAIVPLWIVGVTFATLRRANLRRVPLVTGVALAAVLLNGIFDGASAVYFVLQSAFALAAGGVAAALIAERGANRRDPLTGVLSRAAGVSELERKLRRPHAADGGVDVAFVDLVDFKAVNDTHGHAVGDAVLAAVGGRLTSAVRGDDTVFRYGGDEFVVVGGGPDLAARLEAVFTPPVATSAGPVAVAARVGLLRGEAVGDVRSVLAEADRRMYAARATREEPRERRRDARLEDERPDPHGGRVADRAAD